MWDTRPERPKAIGSPSRDCTAGDCPCLPALGDAFCLAVTVGKGPCGCQSPPRIAHQQPPTPRSFLASEPVPGGSHLPVVFLGGSGTSWIASPSTGPSTSKRRPAFAGRLL